MYDGDDESAGAGHRPTRAACDEPKERISRPGASEPPRWPRRPYPAAAWEPAWTSDSDRARPELMAVTPVYTKKLTVPVYTTN